MLSGIGRAAPGALLNVVQPEQNNKLYRASLCRVIGACHAYEIYPSQSPLNDADRHIESVAGKIH